MLYIAVVDDEQAHRDILTKYIREWGEETEIKAFSGAEAFYFHWCGDQRWDVLFLDIMMEDREAGVSLARKLREKGNAVTIIFTTGIPDYMQEGFEVEALHYLLKPLNREKVWECLDKCLLRKGKESKNVLLPGEEGLVRVDISQILFAEALGHYCTLTCAAEERDSEKLLQLRTGIRELGQTLNADGEGEEFVFTHRCYLINLRRVAKLGRQEVIMDNGAAVPVSRRLYQDVNARFIQKFARR